MSAASCLALLRREIVGRMAFSFHDRVDITPIQRAALLHAGYNEFRLTCVAPDSTSEGALPSRALRLARATEQRGRKYIA